MESQILQQTKNPFLEREEYIIKITNETTPTFDEAKSQIGKDTDLIVIKKINTNFGKKTFEVEAVVYDNKEAKEKIETIPKKVKKKIEAERKVAEEATAKAKAAEEATKKAEEEAKAAAETASEETKPEENKNE
ncbi:MAG: hypothetical protein KJ592_02255 [Nanoarchaeota archaeon]|nr:hypothetical protein [Nanoarchaeota archaeon]